MSAISILEIAFVVALFSFVSLIRLVVSAIERRGRVLWQVDAKLDLLLKHAGLEFDPYKSLPRNVVDALQRGERIRAIKSYRDATGAGLKEAKDFIEEAQRRVT